MNWAQFKEFHYYLRLCGSVVAYWFTTQEIVGSNTAFLQKYPSDSVDSL